MAVTTTKQLMPTHSNIIFYSGEIELGEGGAEKIILNRSKLNVNQCCHPLAKKKKSILKCINRSVTCRMDKVTLPTAIRYKFSVQP